MFVDRIDVVRPCSLRALALVMALSLMALTKAPGADAQALEGYSVGAGSSTSYLVIDFAQTGGDAYYFTYHYDGAATGFDLLTDIAAGGGLTVFTTVYSFGTAIDGFAYGGQSIDIGFEADTGRNWSYWVDGGFQDSNFDTFFSLDEAAAAGSYTSAEVGAEGRLLADGSVDGWIVNVSSFNTQGNPATNNPPAAVPEPSTVALGLGLVALGLAHRRPRSAKG